MCTQSWRLSREKEAHHNQRDEEKKNHIETRIHTRTLDSLLRMIFRSVDMYWCWVCACDSHVYQMDLPCYSLNWMWVSAHMRRREVQTEDKMNRQYSPDSMQAAMNRLCMVVLFAIFKRAQRTHNPKRVTQKLVCAYVHIMNHIALVLTAHFTFMHSSSIFFVFW